MDASNVIEKAFAMPLTSPSFPRGPYRYASREHLIVTYRTDRAALELAVPEPLKIGDPFVRSVPGSGAIRGPLSTFRCGSTLSPAPIHTTCFSTCTHRSL